MRKKRRDIDIAWNKDVTVVIEDGNGVEVLRERFGPPNWRNEDQLIQTMLPKLSEDSVIPKRYWITDWDPNSRTLYVRLAWKKEKKGKKEGRKRKRPITIDLFQNKSTNA